MGFRNYSLNICNHDDDSSKNFFFSFDHLRESFQPPDCVANWNWISLIRILNWIRNAIRSIVWENFWNYRTKTINLQFSSVALNIAWIHIELNGSTAFCFGRERNTHWLRSGHANKEMVKVEGWNINVNAGTACRYMMLRYVNCNSGKQIACH